MTMPLSALLFPSALLTLAVFGLFESWSAGRKWSRLLSVVFAFYVAYFVIANRAQWLLAGPQDAARVGLWIIAPPALFAAGWLLIHRRRAIRK